MGYDYKINITDVTTGEDVAIKLERIRTKHPQLLYESKLYRILQGEPGVPYMRWFGVDVSFFPNSKISSPTDNNPPN
jgi:hypothetical protein